ncbi:CG42460 [Drosophila busckii]|uniref:CG42460 n=1 Tax=Drosophila busckii TaxID=30019 RepID=A0A0M5J3T7_DROBS|nr:male accessory gland serine protease inhibitor [Drosophila busckii]ALC44094.1 CG42460 [Drosophila busckii]
MQLFYLLLILMVIAPEPMLSDRMLITDKCKQPPFHEVKPDGVKTCGMKVTRWSYEEANNKCKSFMFGQCRHNRNFFATEKKCEYECKLIDNNGKQVKMKQLYPTKPSSD